MLERPVIGSFGSGIKTAGRQLAAFQMIADAIAADALAGARLVTAVAGSQIFFFLALHLSDSAQGSRENKFTVSGVQATAWALRA
jgi:hypothetical protein